MSGFLAAIKWRWVGQSDGRTAVLRVRAARKSLASSPRGKQLYYKETRSADID